MVSDIGGALGLVLGLSILDLLVYASKFMRKGVSGLVTLKKEADNTKVSISKVSLMLKYVIDKKSKKQIEKNCKQVFAKSTTLSPN